MDLRFKQLLFSSFLILAIRVELAQSNTEDFNGWTEVVSRGEVVPIVTSSSGCTNTHQRSVLGNMLPCVPRPTLVAIPNPSKDNSNGNTQNGRSVVHLMPSYVSIDRCTGSCLGSPTPGAWMCQPSSTENVTFQVMAVHTTFSTGQWDTICTTAIVERHLACQCTCKQKPEHCNSKIHVYHYQSCTCQCKNQEGMANCGSGKKWDPRTCSCMCPRNSWRLCSTGYTYDFQDSCSCVRTYSIASGGLTFIVVFVVAFCVIASLVVMHFKKRRILSRRVQSDSNIEQLLREAFISETDANAMRMTPVTSAATLASNQR